MKGSAHPELRSVAKRVNWIGAIRDVWTGVPNLTELKFQVWPTGASSSFPEETAEHEPDVGRALS